MSDTLADVFRYIEMTDDALGKLMLAGEVRKTANLRQVVYRLNDAKQTLIYVYSDMSKEFYQPKHK